MILVGDWAPGGQRVHIRLGEGLVLGNLEGPILPGDHGLSPILKAGPHLHSIHLPESGPSWAFTMANNHLMDYGSAGLEATLVALGNCGSAAAGAGRSLAESRRPCRVEENGIGVGIISCCEAQFGVARGNGPGVAEMGPWVYKLIAQLRTEGEAVVVSVHAAVEDSPWPSPKVQELYRSFIDAGASVVHGHHSHVPQGYEHHEHGVIFYGMGNFAVMPAKWRNTPNALWSLGAEVDISLRPMAVRIKTFEVREQAGEVVVEESTPEEHADHLNYLEKCNAPLKDSLLGEAIWQETCLRAFSHYGAAYLNLPSAKPGPLRERFRAFRRAARKLLPTSAMFPHKSPGTDDYRLWYHMVACESHRDMLVTALGILAGEIPDMRNDATRQLADELMPWSIE